MYLEMDSLPSCSVKFLLTTRYFIHLTYAPIPNHVYLGVTSL